MKFNNYLLTLLFFFITMQTNAQENTENVKIIYNKENIPISVETSMPKIKNNIQKVYKGIYKDGKPYEGYFFVEDKEFEDMYSYYQYYEKGILKKQYSSDFLKEMWEKEAKGENFSEHIEEFNQETIFENGKPKNGSVIYPPYKEKSGIAVPIVIYKDFKPQKVFLDVFGIHYANRLIFEYHNQTIRVSVVKENEKWIVKKKDNWIYIKSADKEATDRFLTVTEGTPDSFSVYYVENGIVKQENFLLPQDGNHSKDGTITTLSNHLPIRTSKTIEAFFNELVQIIQEKGLADLEEFGEKFNKIEQTEILFYMLYNGEGIAEEGCKVLSLSEGGYLLQCYTATRAIFSKKVKSSDEINVEEIKKIMYGTFSPQR